MKHLLALLFAPLLVTQPEVRADGKLPEPTRLRQIISPGLTVTHVPGHFVTVVHGSCPGLIHLEEETVQGQGWDEK